MQAGVNNRPVIPDERYMREAIRQARRGLGKTSPNPAVGAVLVQRGEVVGQGYHRWYGDKHAEAHAIENATADIRGATLYTTLEPCCHRPKRNPPCVEAILEKGIARVVVGSIDPNPLVNGKGIEILRQAGTIVDSGVLEEQCRRLNEPYYKYMRTGLPFIVVKYAQTLDGRIATRSGQSHWISSPSTLKYAHQLRARYDAILVGVETVIADDPRLTVRLVKGKNPVRVVADSTLRIPPAARVLQGLDAAGTIIATTGRADPAKAAALRGAGAEVIVLGEDCQGHVDLQELVTHLARRQITSILVEGGSRMITALMRASLVDKLVVVIAPKVLGEGIPAVGDLQVHTLDGALRLCRVTARRMGEDFVVEGTVLRSPHLARGSAHSIE